MSLPLTVLRQEDLVVSETAYPLLSLRVKLGHTGILVHKGQPSRSSNGRHRPGTRDVSYNLIVLFLSSKDNRFIDVRKIK